MFYTMEFIMIQSYSKLKVDSYVLMASSPADDNRPDIDKNTSLRVDNPLSTHDRSPQ